VADFTPLWGRLTAVPEFKGMEGHSEGPMSAPLHFPDADERSREPEDSDELSEDDDDADLIDPLVLVLEAEERGEERAKLEMKPELDRLTAENEQLRDLVEQLLERNRVSEARLGDQVAELVLGVSGRVIGDALATNPRALREVLRVAMERFPVQGELRVRCPPDRVDQVQSWVAGQKGATVIGDDAVSQGVIVESGGASVEATLGAALTGLEAAVRAWQEGQ
jgi:flagellar biosynthesis/type III secretory pathway protein FliH